jgi:hypothetical protein
VVVAEAGVGVAVRVTAVPLVKLALQVVPQSIPAGLDVMVPVPVPALITASIGGPPGGPPNMATTLCVPVTVTVHGLVPLHPPPLQPVNVDPPLGVGVEAGLVAVAGDDVLSYTEARTPVASLI